MTWSAGAIQSHEIGEDFDTHDSESNDEQDELLRGVVLKCPAYDDTGDTNNTCKRDE